ncbi:snoaL-like domain-containing protein [Ditylenchus destructor]|nr:snoaL-like domain-containing protein [Ditylenchus destructor]
MYAHNNNTKNSGDGCEKLKDRNIFRHIPLHSALLENMNMALFQEIKSRQEDFMKVFNAGDAHKASEVYDPEGYFMPNGRSPVKGRAGIEAYFKQDMSEGVNSVQIITEEVNGSGDWAFERGSYHLDGARGTESGAYLLVWKRVNGVWLIHNDCFNVIKPAGTE